MIISLLLLAGKGVRLNKNTYKQYLKINDKYLFEYPLKTLLEVNEINKVILIVDFNHFEEIKSFVKKEYKEYQIDVVIGGNSRKESVFNGLKYIKNAYKNCKYVLIHDASRVLVSSSIIENNIKAVKKYGATSTFVKENDTVCLSSNLKNIENYLDREKIIKLQTPQCFKFDIIYNAHLNNLNEATDDASLVKSLGNEIYLVRGDERNFKITTSSDLIILESLLNGK